MIDKRLLVDTVAIAKVAEVDSWGKVTYTEPVTLSHVRFDRNLERVGTGNHRSEAKPSVLFVYPKFCPIELDDSYLGAKVSHDDHEYIVKKIIPHPHPFKKAIFCYEVEVV